MTTSGTPASEDDVRKTKLRQAYTLATQELREVNKKQFQELQVKHAAALGIEWRPRQTAQERDAETFDSLLAQYPDFAKRVPKDAAPDSGS